MAEFGARSHREKPAKEYGRRRLFAIKLSLVLHLYTWSIGPRRLRPKAHYCFKVSGIRTATIAPEANVKPAMNDMETPKPKVSATPPTMRAPTA